MSRPRPVFSLAILLASVLFLGDARPTLAQATTKQTESKTKARRATPGTYMGRPIAQVMGYQGADWLFRDSREAEEQPEQMLDALKIKPGQTVADIGAGAGYTSLRLSKRVGETGTVLATDVQPQMLAMLAENARTVGVKNIQPIRSTQTDTKLPEGKVDLALMVDVYHEASDPEALLRGLKKALKPGGRLVFVEFRGEDPEVPIKPEHKMTLAQVKKEVEPQGFVFKESFEFLPWQHIIIFEKPAEETKPAEPEKKG
jgi:ubiquinone/menaquinone biosynthesis C-methylase UbiE